jgi:hypothetical protein
VRLLDLGILFFWLGSSEVYFAVKGAQSHRALARETRDSTLSVQLTLTLIPANRDAKMCTWEGTVKSVYGGLAAQQAVAQMLKGWRPSVPQLFDMPPPAGHQQQQQPNAMSEAAELQTLQDRTVKHGLGW